MRQDGGVGDTKACPYCAEQIKVEATKCKHCGEFLSAANTPAAAPPPAVKRKNWKPLVVVFGGLVAIVVVVGACGAYRNGTFANDKYDPVALRKLFDGFPRSTQDCVIRELETMLTDDELARMSNNRAMSRVEETAMREAFAACP